MTLLHHTLGRAAWLVLGGVAALAAAWHLEGRQQTPDWTVAGQQEAATDNKYRFDVRVLAGQNAALLHRADALARDTAQLAKNLQVAWHQVEGLVTSLDSLHRAPLTPAVRRYAEACGAAIDSCSRRAGLLAQALEGEHAKANLALIRAAHADSIIASGLRATQCKMLLVLPCLSRAHALELGLVAGVVGTLVLVRH